MAGLTIHGFPLSTYVRTVRLVCEEKAIAYDLNPILPSDSKAQGLHPFGKIPVLTDGDLTLFESPAIARHLDETRAGPELQPQEPRARARMNQWISVVGDVVYDTMVRRYVLQYAFPRGPEGQPDRPVIEVALPEIRDQLAVLDRAVGDAGFLAGSSVTLADLFLAPILFYLRRLPEGADLMAAAPDLERAYGAIAARPSFAATEPELPPIFAA